MKKVSSILKQPGYRSVCAPCGPCYAVEGCGESEFYAFQTYEGDYLQVISNNRGSLSNGSGNYTSCISYEDAVNNALYNAMAASLYRLGALPQWDEWTADTANTEISATASCYCGWTGDPVTVTKEAGTYTGFWTVAEANQYAYGQAKAEASSTLDCIEPEL